MDLSDELIGLGGDDREGLEIASVRPLPRVPDAGEGERSRFSESDGEDALDGFGCFYLLGRQAGRDAEEIPLANCSSSATERVSDNQQTYCRCEHILARSPLR